MGAITTRLTYQAYLALPEIKRRYDIVDGVLEYMSPAPTLYHQRVLGNLFLALHAFVSRGNLGDVLLAPLDIIISKKPLRTRQADLIFIATGRLNVAKDQIEDPPDVAVEILSPGNTPRNCRPSWTITLTLACPRCGLPRRFQRLSRSWCWKKASIVPQASTHLAVLYTRLLAGFTLPKDIFA